MAYFCRFCTSARLILVFILFLVLLTSLLRPCSVVAQQNQEDFPLWLENFKKEAAAAGIRLTTLDTALNDAEFLPWVIDADRRQPEFKKTLAEYLAGAVTKSRIRQGGRLLKENRKLLNRVASKYKVQPHYLVALWGIETNFGRNTGKVPIFSALATLAFDARRSKYFRQELMNALRILDSGQLSKSQFVGSWAGAMGNLQFMPSTFLRYAIDGNGDGRIDLWNTQEDYLSSAANYLHKSGWQWGYRWGRVVRVPPNIENSSVDLDFQSSLGTWQKKGIRLKNGQNLPGNKLPASLIMPEGSEGDAFLVYENYRVLMKWNRAHSFALAVGMLAERIAME